MHACALGRVLALMWGSYHDLAEPSQAVHQGCFRHCYKRALLRLAIFWNGESTPLPTGFGFTTCLIICISPHTDPPAFWEVEAKRSGVLVGSCCCRTWHVPAWPAAQGCFLSLDVARHSFVCIAGKLWASSAWCLLWSPFGTADCTSSPRYSWNGTCLEKPTQLF